MSDQSNLCYIIDYQRNYYRLDNNNQLVVAENKEQACEFRTEEANEKIRAGRKAQFYSTVPVDETIKNSMFCADAFQKALGTKENLSKAREALKQICKLDTRKYAPRKLEELFEGAVELRNEAQSGIQDETQIEAQSETIVEEEVAMEDNTMGYVKRETVFDGRKNDWLDFAKQQVEFYGNINQYITNLYIRMDELDELIESLLEETEDANYNVTQGYRVFKMLKEFRKERKAIKTELQYLEPMAACFDCGAMEEAYRYSLEVIQDVMGVGDNAVEAMVEQPETVANVV